MKTFLHLVLLALILLPASAQARKDKGTTDGAVYIFGVGTGFSDSTVYISDLQTLDTARIEPRTGFLNRMPEYAEQYRAALQTAYPGLITCAVFYAEDRKAAEKKHAKLLRHYAKQRGTRTVEVGRDKFSFTTLTPQEPTKTITVVEEGAPMQKPPKKK